MRTRTRLASLALLTAVAAAGCDNGTELPLPELIITNTWDVEGQSDRSFSFTSGDDGQTEGSFTGNESIAPDIQNPLTGAWAHGEIQFSVGGSRGGAYYSGSFTDLTNRFTVSSSTETITLSRQQN